ncbi:MinD/ParA family ATP-binding protein [Pseudomonas chlororaphis]|uniref:MinD/ParA family ATP-binding protein n=1 Tax=Pseudomonas chlororaphis TaxID=587753 RepID=UPI0009BBE4F9|nr:AAA family ATPase [Pseudomonas chlororaphis]
MRVHFDDSLKLLITIIADKLGGTALAEGVVLRDTTGRLAFFCNSMLSSETLNQLSEQLHLALGVYARSDQVVADISEYGVEELLTDEAIITLEVDGYNVRLIDRRLVGADWLRDPVNLAPPPPRFVFSSIKGGVGRSTALAVVAADLAARGLKILAIDLDIEAPGLGSILLNDETLPEFGLLDALVENGLAPLDERFLADLISPSPLTGNNGRIDVMPVLGRRSLENPADVLAKIARAYAEDVNSEGQVISVLDQISLLVDQFSDPRRYDVILVDARAGLHETTASALLGLGAEVFLFGLDEPQTYQGFKVLLSHMAQFNKSDQLPGWLSRFTIVQGKAPAESELRQEFVEKCRRLLIDVGFGVEQKSVSFNGAQEVSDFNELEWNDDISDADVLPLDEPFYLTPIAIIDDPRYKSFNPQLKRDLIENSIYSSSYQEILDKINSSLPQQLE